MNEKGKGDNIGDFAFFGPTFGNGNPGSDIFIDDSPNINLSSVRYIENSYSGKK